MKLAKYLADYIEHEQDCQRVCGLLDMEETIQAGIEAFASTENVTVRVHREDYTVREVFE